MKTFGLFFILVSIIAVDQSVAASTSAAPVVTQGGTVAPNNGASNVPTAVTTMSTVTTTTTAAATVVTQGGTVAPNNGASNVPTAVTTMSAVTTTTTAAARETISAVLTFSNVTWRDSLSNASDPTTAKIITTITTEIEKAVTGATVKSVTLTSGSVIATVVMEVSAGTTASAVQTAITSQSTTIGNAITAAAGDGSNWGTVTVTATSVNQSGAGEVTASVLLLLAAIVTKYLV